MAAKRRKSGRKPSKGVSGNPQRRAEQVKAQQAGRAPRESLAGSGPRTWPWWGESHRAVLARVRETEWPSRLLDIETLAGQIAGDEFHARVSAPGPRTGLTPAGWLRALTETAMDAMDAGWAGGGKDWPRLWAFCCGIADEETAGELEAGGREIAAAGDTLVPGVPLPWYQPAGGTDVLLARDVYGARVLLAAPFSDPARPSDVDHWYAWDLDWCTLGLVVGAGAYDSAGAALAEWQEAVGPAADGAAFGPCRPETGLRLLEQAQQASMQADSVLGDEPAEYFREKARLTRRATALAAEFARRLPAERRSEAEARNAAVEDFLAQRTQKAWSSPAGQPGAEDLLDLILEAWGPEVPPDERAFFACSPHRIEECAGFLRDAYQPEPVSRALAMLPDWVQWCAARTELDGEFAERAASAARAEAATPAGARPPKRKVPFRRPE